MIFGIRSFNLFFEIFCRFTKMAIKLTTKVANLSNKIDYKEIEFIQKMDTSIKTVSSTNIMSASRKN